MINKCKGKLFNWIISSAIISLLLFSVIGFINGYNVAKEITDLWVYALDSEIIFERLCHGGMGLLIGVLTWCALWCCIGGIFSIIKPNKEGII